MRSVGRKLHQNKFTSAAVKVVEAGQGHPQVDLERSWSKAKWVFGKTLANSQHNLRKNTASIRGKELTGYVLKDYRIVRQIDSYPLSLRAIICVIPPAPPSPWN